MSIILKSERKSTWARLVILGCYLLLLIGGTTMVFPFLWMTSGSFKGKMDVHQYDFIPAFLIDDEVLFKRYLEEKYNERIQDYRIATGDDALRFRMVSSPQLPVKQLLQDWLEFCREESVPSSFHMGSMTYRSGNRQKIIPKNLREFRNYIKEICNGDEKIFRQNYSSVLQNWNYLEANIERYLDRNYSLVPDDNLTIAFNDFKKNSQYSERIYLSVNGDYQDKCKGDQQFNGEISKFNKLNNTTYQSFSEIILIPTVPKSIGRISWENYVRNYIHPQFIQVSEPALQLYSKFLQEKYADIKNLNKLYKSSFSTFQDIVFPVDLGYSIPAAFDFVAFLEDDERLPIEYITLDTPEMRWQKYLRSAYSSLESLNKAHGVEYASFVEIFLPQKQMDYHFVLNHTLELRLHYLTRNYKMVFEYISGHGQGIINTIIYCSLAVLLALTVNPLAAYALSRYNLPTQYKVLLFFITTIAFPAMVTMIPTYLLLRDLGLLNTFAALVLPGAANGYSIFLLKGFFDTLPRELYDASDIDGASEWFKFWNITMKLSKPVLAIIALFAFTAAYGNYMFALLLCQDSDMWTLMVWLSQLNWHTTQGVQFASFLIAAVPTLVVFIFAQRVIIQGIVVPVEK